MPVGELKDNCLADLWVGRFPTNLLFPQGNFKADSTELVDFLLRRFDYQNNLLQVFSKGRLVYSQTEAEAAEAAASKLASAVVLQPTRAR